VSGPDSTEKHFQVWSAVFDLMVVVLGKVLILVAEGGRLENGQQ